MSAGAYVTDVPYTGNYIAESAPAWLDHVGLLGGFAAPGAAGDFAWCDLGCGNGLTANLLAAMNPQGRFHGVDLMPAHIDAARRLAAEAAIGNAVFHHADFRSAAALGLPQFDYIAAHGVYSWVGAQARDDLRHFVQTHLKPGGLLYLSYNAMPGRAADLPLQRLVHGLAQRAAGDSLLRVDAAAAVVRRLAATRAPALHAASMLELLVPSGGKGMPPAYLAHELLAGDWEPLFVTDVRAQMRGIGLLPAGSATLMENYDSFVLGQDGRQALAGIDDDDLRELARDFLINQHFRRDVYIRDGRALADQERLDALLAGSFSLPGPAARTGFSAETPAGRLDFDNAASRRIVAALSRGPRSLAGLGTAAIDEAELAGAALALAAAGAIAPVRGGRAAVDRINAAIQRGLGGAEELRLLALPCGIAVSTEAGLLRQLRDGGMLDEYPGWAEFLRAQKL